MSESLFADKVLLEHRFGFSRHEARQLRRRRVFILPTRQGLLFAMMLLVMLVGAINYDNNLAYLLTFLLASLTLVAIFFTHRNIAGLIVDMHPATAVFAGDNAEFAINLDNHNQLPRYSLHLKKKNSTRPWYWPWYSVQSLATLDIATNSRLQQTVAIPMLQRGEYTFGSLIMSTVYPLGLFEAWSTANFAATCLVYPQPKGTQPLPDSLPGNEHGELHQKNGVDDYIGVRAYRHGDSSRQIDWKAYARERGLHRKLFAGNNNEYLSFKLSDLSSIMDTEQALSQLCLWILQAEQAGFAYSLQLDEKSLAIGMGSQHKHECLKQLALYGN